MEESSEDGHLPLALDLYVRDPLTPKRGLYVVTLDKSLYQKHTYGLTNKDIYCSITHNSKTLETTQITRNRESVM